MKDLTRGSTTDAHWLQEQMDELEGRWDAVCKLSVSKQDRLEASVLQVLSNGSQQSTCTVIIKKNLFRIDYLAQINDD